MTLEIHESGVVVDAVPAMFPGMVRVGDELIVSFSTVPDGWPGGTVGTVRSVDGGRTWSEPDVVARPTDGEEAVLNAVGMTVLADGTVLLPYNGVRWTPGMGVAGRQISARLLRSVDGGRTWTGGAPVDVDFHSPAVYGSMVEIGDRVLWPIWGQRSPGERWRSVLLESTDGGLSWELGATIAFDPNARLGTSYAQPEVTGVGSDGLPDVGAITDPDFRPHSPIDGFSETSVVGLADGRQLAILRQQGVDGDAGLEFYRSYSVDDARSWSPRQRVGFPGMSPVLHTLGSGALLLAYRRFAPDGGVVPPGVDVRVGTPDGASWSDPVALVDPHGFQPTAEYQVGYPAIVDLPGDNVLAVFYSFDPATKERFVAWNRIGYITKPARP
jgi:hypothetical protein